jgi:predicted metal-dependent enzyme (double-stranded beta helix superfamily)
MLFGLPLCRQGVWNSRIETFVRSPDMVDLDKFVEDCRAALKTRNPAAVVEGLVKDVIADPQGLDAAFKARVKGKSLVDRIIYRDKQLSVVQVATEPGLRSPVHNHCMWAVIGVYEGQEHNRFFSDADDAPEQIGERLLQRGDICVLSADDIHAIHNPLQTVSSAIHVYGGDLVAREGRSMWNPRTDAREDYEIGRLSSYVKELSSMA